MRSVAVVLGVLASGALAAFVSLSACSGGGNAASADASVGPGQALGAACNSSLADPCAPSQSSCAAVLCTDGVCTQFVIDGGPSCSIADTGAVIIPPVSALCTSSADCDGGALCGFLASGVCTVTGVCVAPASGTLPTPACGCNGQPDPYIASDFTAAPASSPGACVDAGPDAGQEAGSDGGVDAGSDAASEDGSIDAGGSSDAGDGAPE